MVKNKKPQGRVGLCSRDWAHTSDPDQRISLDWILHQPNNPLYGCKLQKCMYIKKPHRT
jgi:hypothetical protein